jgi:predicted nucleotidyltransferase
MDGFRKSALEYTGRLAELLGERLRGVVLYGSVSRGEAVAGVSDVNLLVLLEAIDADVLRRLAPEARGWLDRERAVPLVLTWDEWTAASDAFAVETADMVDSHELLHGDDPLDGRTVERRYLRLQAERELRAKLIHLREGTLVSADRPEDLGRLLLVALPSVATYLRTALRLAGERAPLATPETLRAGAALVAAEADPLLRLWEMRGRREIPRTEVEDPLMVAVHEILERTVAYVDTLPGEVS